MIEDEQPKGILAAPGEYTVTLIKQIDGNTIDLSSTKSFQVVPMRKGALEGPTTEATTAFWRELSDLSRSISAVRITIEKALNRMDFLKTALIRSESIPGNLDKEMHELRQNLLHMDEDVNGNRSKRKIGEKRKPTLVSRLNYAMSASNNTYGPTTTQTKSFDIARKKFEELKVKLDNLIFTQMPDLEKRLIEAGAPWVEGQPIPKYKN